MAVSNELAGKTPWEFACAWYKPSEIALSIERQRYGLAWLTTESSRIPTDVYSQEFAEWLTHQYRLAMTKGIDIGRRSAQSFDPPTPPQEQET